MFREGNTTRSINTGTGTSYNGITDPDMKFCKGLNITKFSAIVFHYFNSADVEQIK